MASTAANKNKKRNTTTRAKSKSRPYSGKKRTGASKAQIFFLLFMVFVIVALVVYWCVTSQSFNIASKNKLQLHFIDVGQGDCTLIITPEGESMLIDSGKDRESEKVISYITELGVRELDYMVISHFHDDHYGSCDEVAEKINVNTVIVNAAPPDNNTEKALFETFENEGCEVITVSAGYSFNMGELEIGILAPFEITDGGGNNDSLVMKLTYMESTFLFTGDAETIEEGALLDEYTEETLSCDLIKVGHHGSSTSSSKDFLDAADPSVALISVGEGNSYGHPHKSVIDAYNERDIDIYRTDELGDIVILCDGEKLMLYEKTEGPIERLLELIGA